MSGRGGPTETPLPPFDENEGWRDVPLEACDEPLVPVADIGPRVIDLPAYRRRGLPGALERNWLREGVAARLERVAADLPPGYGLLVWDGYRPLQTQAWLFRSYVDELIATHPDWPADALEEAAARYVTPPSRSQVAPPPHLTGGAVDLTLADAAGRALDLGTGFDAFVPEAASRALEAQAGAARERRRLLFWAMHAQGFTAHTEEWWHFDYGNQFWGRVTGRPARYGPAEAPAG